MADPFKPKFVDLVRTFTTTTGTGAIVPGAAVAGFASFATALVAGDVFYYCIQGVDKPAEREVGRGTLLANGTITRAPISGTATNFTIGNKTIALVAAAEWYAKIDDGLTAAASAGTAAGQATAATRVALAAMVVTAGATAMLTEAGREGVFRFTSGNQSARVTGDPRQGMVVAPASDTSGANGAWLRIKVGAINVTWFGAVADFVVDDLPAFNAAMAALPTAGGTITVPAGRYYLSDTLNLHKTIWLTGEGTNWNGDGSTILRFPPNKNGIVVNHNNTHGDGDGTQGSATGSTIEGIVLWGGGVSVDGSGNVTSYASGLATSGHGVRIRTTGVKLRDVNTVCFGGDGFNVECFAGSSGYFQGNANNFEISFCQSIYNRGNGYFFKGTDVNAGKISICSAISNGGGGFIDYSFLGNTYDACHVRDCGKVDPTGSNGPVGCCTYGGVSYYVVQGQETAASTTVPGANANVWVAQGNYAQKAWVTGLTWRNGSCYGTALDNANARNVFTGCYGEASQIPVQAAAPSLFQGGLLDEVSFSPQSTAVWIAAFSNALGAPAFRTSNYRGLANARDTWIGPAGGVSSPGDIFGHYDGTYTSRLYDNAGGLQLDMAGGAVWRSDSPVAAVPNLFTARQLKICSVADINGGNRVAYSSAAPTTGAWTQGAIIFNEAPSSGTLLWVCTASGTPGTWLAVSNAGATEASNADIWTGTDSANKITARRLYTAAAEIALTDGATITPDFNTGLNFGVTLAGSRTIANPTNAKSGQSGYIAVTQDATGSRTLSFGANWKFAGGAPALTATANAIDLISYAVRPGGTILATLSKAFA